MNDRPPVLEPIQPTPPAMPAAPRRSSQKGNVLLALAGVIAMGGLAFAAGRFTAPVTTATGPGGNFGQFPGGSFDPGSFPGGGQGGPGGFAAVLGGGNLRGHVTAVSDTAITLELENGTTVEVPIDDSTDYQAAASSTPSDVVVGSTVVVQTGESSVIPGASPAVSFDPTSGQPQLSFGTAEQVIVLDE